MEDLEKYIFDPKNPDKFLAYKLLKKVYKDNYVLLDDEFFIELFEDEIFDSEFESEIWNKYVNFTDLSIEEKIELYIQNYTQKDFEQLISSKSKKITEKTKYFKEFISIQFNQASLLGYDFNVNTFILKKHFEVFFHSKRNVYQNFSFSKTFNKNLLILLTKKYASLLHKINFDRTSILLTSVEDFEFIYKNIITERKEWFPNLKPILLKKKSDIHQLLDFISRDVKKTTLKLIDKNIKIPYLSKLHLQNYFFLKNIEIPSLTNQKEIYFVGENGDGKTILLQAIALALRGNQNIGEVINMVKSNFNKKEDEKLSLTAIDSKNEKYHFIENPNQQESSYPYIYGYGVNRFRHHAKDKDTEGYLTLFDDDVYLENPVEWLQYLHYKEAVNDVSDVSLEVAIGLLKELLDDIEEIEVSPDEVLFTSKGTKNQFEQLSHGYKSVIVWVGDLLSRLAKQQPYETNLANFRGAVLVDEIGLFLHPQWQYSIVSKLRSHFKQLQFIFTTHSPIVLLGASKDAIFYKVYKEEGETKISERLTDISSLMANSLLTSPLVGLDSAATRSFDENQAQNVSDDDYVYQKIHQVIQQKIKENPAVLKEETILNWVKEELAKLENTK